MVKRVIVTLHCTACDARLDRYARRLNAFTSEAAMIPSQRHLFDIPDDVAYLNCAYMGPLSKAVVEAMAVGIATKVQPWTYTAADFFVHPEKVRAQCARVVGATPEDIALVPSASYGMQIAANNLPLAAGQEIVVVADQFPSNVYPWREAAKAADAAIVTVETGEHTSLTEAVLAAINERTAVVAAAHCRWTDGALLDLERVGNRCREVGAALALDLTQSAGAMPFHTMRVRPDFAVAAGYKWLLAPYSTGFLYVAPRWQDGVPLENNWLNRAGSEDFAGLVNYRDDFQPGARRYDMGERANAAQLLGFGKALEYLLDHSVEEIYRTLSARTAAIAERAAGLGMQALPSDRRAGHFLGLTRPDGLPDGLLPALAERQVFVSVRGSSLRITPHLYNTDADVDRMFDALEAALRG